MTWTLETSFERHRTHGDVGARGEVIDRTADELLRIEIHLSQDSLIAEDRLPQTFLAAIEQSEKYERDRPLQPQLAGGSSPGTARSCSSASASS